jgi:hypothetical protein
MKASKTNVENLFSDPIMTFVPLVLINVLAVLIPSGPPPEPGPTRVAHEQSDLAAEQGRLKRHWETLRRQEENVADDGQRLSEAQKQLNELVVHQQALQTQITQLQEEIESLRKKVPDPSQKDAQKRLQDLQSLLKQKQAELAGLDRAIQAKREAYQRIVSDKEAERARLQVALDEETARLVALVQKEKRRTIQGDGILAAPVEPTDKKPSYVELAGNKAFVIVVKGEVNKDLYDLSYNAFGNPTIKRKTGARGESIEQITKPDSSFQRKLKQLNPAQDAVILLVRSDSLSSYQAARQTLKKMGLPMGWRPCIWDQMSGGGGGNEEIPKD